MRNTTITLDEKVLEDARAYSASLGFSFNAWVNKIILEAITRSPRQSMNSLLEIADRCAGNSAGKTWTKDDIYER